MKKSASTPNYLSVSHQQRCEDASSTIQRATGSTGAVPVANFSSGGMIRHRSVAAMKQYDMPIMTEWNKDVITTFTPSTQYFDTYHRAYGWVQKLKELAFLSDLFNEIDKDGSGLIDKEEFTVFATHPTTKRIFAERFGFQPHQKDKIFLAISDGEEEISYDNWMSYLYNLMKQTGSGQAQEYTVFQRDKKRHDETNKNGFKQFKAMPLPSRGGRQRQPSFANANGPAWFLKMYPANTIV